MKLAVMTYSFARSLRSGEMTTSDVLTFLRSLGVDGVEPMDRYFGDDDPGGLDVCCYDLTDGDGVTGLERAARLGARTILVVPSQTERPHAIEAIRQLVEPAARLGLTLTVENLGFRKDLLGRPEHVEEICDGVGAEMRATFDAGNWLFVDVDPLDALRRLRDRIVHVHLKDWLPDRTGAPLGDGVVNLHGVVEELRRTGYDGWLSVEYEGPGDPRVAVRRGVDYLRTLLV